MEFPRRGGPGASKNLYVPFHPAPGKSACWEKCRNGHYCREGNPGAALRPRLKGRSRVFPTAGDIPTLRRDPTDPLRGSARPPHSCLRGNAWCASPQKFSLLSTSPGSGAAPLSCSPLSEVLVLVTLVMPSLGTRAHGPLRS